MAAISPSANVRCSGGGCARSGSPNLPIHASVLEALGTLGAQQQKVDTKAAVTLPTLTLVVPVRVHRRIRMELADSIDPALLEQVPVPHMGRIEDGHMIVCHMIGYYFMDVENCAAYP